MSKRARTLVLLVFIFLFLVLCVLILLPKKRDGLARVYMLNVGQGDSFLIESKEGKRILIDGGKNTQALSELSKIIPFGNRSIDVVIATHTDADHIGGLPLILSRYDVGLFITTEALSDTSSVQALYKILEKKNIPSYYARHGMDILLNKEEGVEEVFSILFPDRNTKGWNTNAASVVGRLSVGKRSVLFTGDAPSSVEDFLAKAIPKKVEADILKLGHHGSKTSTSQLFLSVVKPQLALVSAGIGNSYGHPAKEVIERIDKAKARVVSTQDKGTVLLKTDGLVWIE